MYTALTHIAFYKCDSSVVLKINRDGKNEYNWKGLDMNKKSWCKNPRNKIKFRAKITQEFIKALKESAKNDMLANSTVLKTLGLSQDHKDIALREGDFLIKDTEHPHLYAYVKFPKQNTVRVDYVFIGRRGRTAKGVKVNKAFASSNRNFNDIMKTTFPEVERATDESRNYWAVPKKEIVHYVFELLTQFLDYREKLANEGRLRYTTFQKDRGLVLNHIATYRLPLAYVGQKTGELFVRMPIKKVRQPHLVTFFTRLQQPPYNQSASVSNNVNKVLKVFFKWCVNLGHVEMRDMPHRYIAKEREMPLRRRFPPQDDIDLLIQHIRTRKKTKGDKLYPRKIIGNYIWDHKYALIFDIMINSDQRSGTVVTLQWDQIDQFTGIAVLRKKGRAIDDAIKKNDVVIQLTKDQLYRINQIPRAINNPYVFWSSKQNSSRNQHINVTNVSRVCREAIKDLQQQGYSISRFSPHDIKRFVSNAIRENYGLEEVKIISDNKDEGILNSVYIKPNSERESHKKLVSETSLKWQKHLEEMRLKKNDPDTIKH